MENLHKYVLLLIVFALLWSGCKKPEVVSFNISGKVTNSADQSPIDNAEVRLSGKQIDAGTFNNNFQELMTVRTNVNGDYSFCVDREAITVFELRIEVDDFFAESLELNPDDLNPEGVNTNNFILDPISKVNIHLQNISPIDEDDQIEFRYINANFDCSCCDNSIKTFIGDDLDTLVSCFIPGSYQLEYLYEVTKGGNTNLITGDQFIEPFVDTTIEIQY